MPVLCLLVFLCVSLGEWACFPTDQQDICRSVDLTSREKIDGKSCTKNCQCRNAAFTGFCVFNECVSASRVQEPSQEPAKEPFVPEDGGDGMPELRESPQERGKEVTPESVAPCEGCRWGRQPASSGEAHGHDVTVDVAGNVYVVGSFAKALKLDDKIVALNSRDKDAGNGDVFVAKWSSQGQLLWARSFGGAGTDDGWRIATDAKGNVYIAGSFQGEFLISSPKGTIKLIAHADNPTRDRDIFAMKLESQKGEVQWAVSGGGVGPDLVNALVVSPQTGQLFVIGEVTGKAVFGSFKARDVGTPQEQMSPAILVASVAADGRWKWLDVFGNGLSKSHGRAMDGILNRDGSLMIVGPYFGPAVPEAKLPNQQGNLLFVSNIKAEDGVVQWTTGVQSPEGNVSTWGYSIAQLDSGDWLVLLGQSGKGSIRLGGVGSAKHQQATGMVILKLKSDRTWAQDFTLSIGTSQPDTTPNRRSRCKGWQLKADQSGAYLAGAFGQSFTLEGQFIRASGTLDLVLAKLDLTNKKFAFLKGGQSPKEERICGLAVANGSMYMTGYFQETLDLSRVFGASLPVLKSSHQGVDVDVPDFFLLRWTP